MGKVLYIEDMEECHELTKGALGNSYEVVSKYTPKEAELEIRKNIGEYEAMISDVNFIYNPEKPANEQTMEGLELIALAREESKRKGIKNLPIFCISSDGSHRKPSLKKGANIFMWKKAFWKGGKEYLDAILEHKKRDERRKRQIR